MKTTRILLLATTLLLLPWCAAPLFSQQDEAKKVVITKSTVAPDGSQTSETIVKKGAAAENFDLEKYLLDNRADNAMLEVKITGGDEERNIVVKGNKTALPRNERDEDEDDDDYYDGYAGYEGYSGYEGYAGYNDADGNEVFLGVDEDSDEKASEPGLIVNVVRGSAADRAGLHDNDKILTLNDIPTNKWSDLSKFVNAQKAGDAVRISYERYGKPGKTTATLTRRNEVSCSTSCEEKGFLGVSDIEKKSENDQPGVAVSITDQSAAAMAGLKDGDVIFQLGDAPIADFEDISDFMAYTKPGETVKVMYERKGKRNTADVLLTAQKNSWSTNSNNWLLGALAPAQSQSPGNNTGNCTVTVSEKDACLGVFSDAYAEGSTEGSRISDFAEESAAREGNMAKDDIITAVDGEQVKNHDDLWKVIAKHKVGDKVTVQYLRNGKTMNTEATLKACHDNSSRVQILDGDGGQVRDFTSWNWNEDDQRQLRDRSIITIRRGEGDAPKVNAVPNSANPGAERGLKITGFRAYPNPDQGQMTVEFSGEAVATTVSFFDLAGHQLFREELNAFGGHYNQQFDLTDYSKGTIIIHVQQGEKVFSEPLQVN